MINLKKPLRTRISRKVRVVSDKDTTVPGYPLCVEVEDVPGSWKKRYYTAEGRYSANETKAPFEHPMDLENVEAVPAAS